MAKRLLTDEEIATLIDVANAKIEEILADGSIDAVPRREALAKLFRASDAISRIRDGRKSKTAKPKGKADKADKPRAGWTPDETDHAGATA